MAASRSSGPSVTRRRAAERSAQDGRPFSNTGRASTQTHSGAAASASVAYSIASVVAWSAYWPSSTIRISGRTAASRRNASPALRTTIARNTPGAAPSARSGGASGASQPSAIAAGGHSALPSFSVSSA